MALGPKTKRWSATRLLNEMKWLPLEKMINKATMKLIHGMVMTSQPPLLTYRTMGSGLDHDHHVTRRTGPNKIGTRPKNIGRTRLTKHQFVARTYEIYATLPDEITEIKSKIMFGKWIDRYLKNPKNLPKKSKTN